MITAILLAAGESRRMGSPKPLLDWGGETLIEYQVDQLRKGGVSQGLGIALWEEMQYNKDGLLMNGNLLDYRLPTARDLPAIETIIVEVPSEEGPYGARIVGEPSIVPGAAVIANAIADATGVFINEAPITPERLLRALGKLGNGTNP